MSKETQMSQRIQPNSHLPKKEKGEFGCRAYCLVETREGNRIDRLECSMDLDNMFCEVILIVKIGILHQRLFTNEQLLQSTAKSVF